MEFVCVSLRAVFFELIISSCRVFFRIEGSISGARNSVAAKKIVNNKNVAKKVAQTEMNMHGFRVMGLIGGRGADGRSRGTSSKETPTYQGKLIALKTMRKEECCFIHGRHN